jgi:hypothetical protein
VVVPFAQAACPNPAVSPSQKNQKLFMSVAMFFFSPVSPKKKKISGLIGLTEQTNAGAHMAP